MNGDNQYYSPLCVEGRYAWQIVPNSFAGYNVSFIHAEYVNRKAFMMGLSCKHGCSHLIRQDHIYSDVLELYGDFNVILNEFPFHVSFDDEHAVDSGGVVRDMFSGFWSCALEKFFDGSGSLVPAAHPTVDLSVFPVLGKIHMATLCVGFYQFTFHFL